MERDRAVNSLKLVVYTVYNTSFGEEVRDCGGKSQRQRISSRTAPSSSSWCETTERLYFGTREATIRRTFRPENGGKWKSWAGKYPSK